MADLEQYLRGRDQTIRYGRRNWFFSDTVASANGAANLYSFAQTREANSADSGQRLGLSDSVLRVPPGHSQGYVHYERHRA